MSWNILTSNIGSWTSDLKCVNGCVCVQSLRYTPPPPSQTGLKTKYYSRIIIFTVSSVQPYVNFLQVYARGHVKNTTSCPVSFSWLTPLLHLGKRKRLEESDMYRILPEDRSETLGEQLQRYRITVATPLECRFSCDCNPHCITSYVM